MGVELWNHKMPDTNWSMIIVTCPRSCWADVIRNELDILKRRNLLDDRTVCLSVEDPSPNIGSGGATLNAILIAAEYWSSMNGFTTVSVDVLKTLNILILHHGREFIYEPSGRGLACIESDTTTNMEYLIHFINKFLSKSKPGIWVSSTDMYLKEESNLESQLESWVDNDVVMLTTSSNIQYATSHGAVCLDKNGYVENILYRATEQELARFCKTDEVQLVSGIVYLSVRVVESLLSLHVLSHIGSCTYMGVDTGEDPLPVSLYFDLLLALGTAMTEEEFCSGKYGLTYNVSRGFTTAKKGALSYARSQVWKELHDYHMLIFPLKGCQYIYLCDDSPLSDNYLPLLQSCKSKHYFTKVAGLNCNVLNSIVQCTVVEQEGGSIIQNSYIVGDFKLHLGTNCLMSDVHLNLNQIKQDIHVPANVVLMGFPIADDTIIHTLYGIHDSPKLSFDNPKSTIFNVLWSQYLAETGITEDDLWPSDNPQTLWTARLFPLENDWQSLLWLQERNKSRLSVWKQCQRCSLQEIFCKIQPQLVLKLRNKIQQEVNVECVIRDKKPPMGNVFLPYFHWACAQGWAYTLLTALDTAASTSKTGEAARLLASIADLLGCLAGPTGGLRSGPGANKTWMAALNLIEESSIPEGVEALAKERSNWLSSPDKLVRAARHYERAAHTLIRQTVMSSKQNIHLTDNSELHNLPLDVWVEVQCPVRVDLQGGWSDTPPICYEQGGSVVNIAILVDGKRPVGAKGCKISEPVIKLILGEDTMYQLNIQVNKLSDLADYNNPAIPGALLKAAIICAETVDLQSDATLEEQLQKRIGGGIMLQSWSNLPQGSGLGTSSILAGAIIAVLWTLCGKEFDRSSLLHAVLYLEQILTTGGGWQDQVGGLLGGVNRGHSDASEHVKIQVESIPLSGSFRHTLEERLVLIYTGKVRLARNLLQNVIRNWYACEKETISCFQALVTNSMEGCESMKQQDMEKLGDCMNIYWQQKKVIAPGCEPVLVQKMMEAIKPFAYGQVLAGAGGGGFMLCLTKQPNMSSQIKQLICNIPDANKISFHTVTIDTEGIVMYINNKQVHIPH